MALSDLHIESSEWERIIQMVIDRFLIPKFNSYDMNASGEWLRTVEARGNTIWGRSYTKQLVDGREPGSMPPVNAIRQWVGYKLGLSGQQAESAAWAIATKIKQEGTSWYQKGGTDLLNVLEEPEVTEFIKNELRKIIVEKTRIELLNETKLAFRSTLGLN